MTDILQLTVFSRYLICVAFGCNKGDESNRYTIHCKRLSGRLSRANGLKQTSSQFSKYNYIRLTM